jgi:uncharacterized protein (DUF2126 family)
LVFDIIDGWKARSVGRCFYHVDPPAGGIYLNRPANAREAEERRMERFVAPMQPATPIAVPEQENNPSFPMTLDLRIPPSGRLNRQEPPDLLP